MIYLDYAATAPVRPEVLDAASVWLRDCYGNASAVYSPGTQAKKLLQNSRRTLASLWNCDFRDIVFTSGGTEANNWAIKKGALLRSGRRHLVVSAIEHPSVLRSAQALERDGFSLTLIPPEPDGRITPEQLSKSLRPDTALCSVQYVNSETGVIHPVRALSDLCHANGTLFHCDCVQALSSQPIDFGDGWADFASFSAHKIGGFKGVGALCIRDGLSLPPLLDGGGQEQHRRSGTEFVPGIAAFALAAEQNQQEQSERNQRISVLRDLLAYELQTALPDVTVNGSLTHRVPENLNLLFPKADSEAMLTYLDMAGVCISAGSACAAGQDIPSPVLTAMGVPPALAAHAMRITLGRDTTEADLYMAANIIIQTYRRLSGAL